MKILPSVLLSVALAALTRAADDVACPYLPLKSAPPIEFSLPPSLLKDFSKDFPSFSFEGVTHTITRKTIAHGSPPKITIERYSATPSIAYDEVLDTVIVRSQECSDTAPSGVAASYSYPWMGLATAATLLGYPQDILSVASFMVATFLPSIMAQEVQCLPSVKIVVETPAGTKDAIEACWNDIKNPLGICPDPFPTFDTCSEATPSCTVAVVGAAAGGLYAATRLVDSGRVPADKVCIFEMQGRVGGRAFSMRGLGPDGDLSVDAGGYRTWPKYTPSLHTLVTEYLGLKVACYDDFAPCTKYTIVDHDGEKSGFASFPEEMLRRLIDKGACWYPHHELVRVTKTDRTQVTQASKRIIEPKETNLYFANGVNATASLATILNIPQRPLLTIVRNSNFDAAGILDSPKLKALHSVQTTVSTKLYLYYPKGHVWWKKLGLTSGDFSFPGDAQNMLLEGRYSDGHVRCDDQNDLDTCHGFLLAVYATDFSGNKAQYFRRFQKERSEPVTFITNQDLEGKEFLAHAHARLAEFHQYENPGAPHSAFQASQAFQQSSPPTFAVLANWNTAIPWAGGGYHGWTNLDNMELAMEPFVQDSIYVVTEAYSMLHGWAEGSIKVADKILEKHLGVERPWDFPVEDIDQSTHDTASASECASTGSTGPPVVHFDDVGLHSTPEDCWSSIHGQVYDLTELVGTHPGGAGPIVGVCGTDGTQAFSAFHAISKLSAITADSQGLVAINSITEHATADDCWTIINTNIYDLSTYNHTGPQSVITGICGIDGTEKFEGKHSSKPELLDKISDKIVAYSVTGVASEGSSSSGGNSGGTGGSGGGGGTEDVFCFTAGALVEMSDGALKPIEDVDEGDFVSTGTGRGKGLVTAKLVHPVEDKVPVTKLETEYGTLAGTPTHPVFQHGQWIDFSDLNDKVLQTSIQFIDTFYNLEIDADKPNGESSHSYVVNGIVVSGLGDNEILNRMYPRQQVWKAMAEKM